MSDRELFDLLEEAGSRIDVGPEPFDAMVAESGRLRRRRGIFTVVAAAAVAGAVTVGVVAIGASDEPAKRPALGPVGQTSHPTDGSDSTEPTDPTASVPPKPEPITMDTVRRIGSAQEFRDYTGPTPPPFSEADALAQTHIPDSYSLGLWDVGIVHHGGSVDWRSVWVIASIRLVPDVYAGMSGPVRTTPAPPREPQPGWLRDVTMYDAATGDSVMGYGF